MRDHYLLFIITVLSLLKAPNAYAAAEMTGTITAKHGDSVKVKYHPHKTAAPEPGDTVDFSTQFQGIEVNAGTGTVTKIDGDSAWVKVIENNPKLKMSAVIHATGRVKSQKAASLVKPKVKSQSDDFDIPPSAIKEDTNKEGGSEYLIHKANRAIEQCKIEEAQQIIERIGPIDRQRSVKLDQRLRSVKSKIHIYQKDLTRLAEAVKSGDIKEIKTMIRKSMKSANCPGDREQLKGIVRKIKVTMQREAQVNRSAMNNAIHSGQTSQNSDLKSRSELAAFILGVVNAINLTK